MQLFIHALMIAFEMTTFILTIQHLEGAFGSGSKLWHEAYKSNYCGRLDAMIKNQKDAVTWLHGEGFNSEQIALAQNLFWELEDRWKKELAVQNIPCEKYRDSYRLIRQKNAKLHWSYPNWVFGFHFDQLNKEKKSNDESM